MWLGVCDWETVLLSTQAVDRLVSNLQIVAWITVCHKALDIVIYTILCVNYGLQCERYVIFVKWSVFFNSAVNFGDYVALVVIDEYLGMDYWNDINRGKGKY